MMKKFSYFISYDNNLLGLMPAKPWNIFPYIYGDQKMNYHDTIGYLNMYYAGTKHSH